MECIHGHRESLSDPITFGGSTEIWVFSPIRHFLLTSIGPWGSSKLGTEKSGQDQHLKRATSPNPYYSHRGLEGFWHRGAETSDGPSLLEATYRSSPRSSTAWLRNRQPKASGRTGKGPFCLQRICGNHGKAEHSVTS